MADFEKHSEKSEAPSFAMPVAAPPAADSILISTLRPVSDPIIINIHDPNDGITPVTFSGEGEGAASIMTAYNLVKAARRQEGTIVLPPPSLPSTGESHDTNEALGTDSNVANENVAASNMSTKTIEKEESNTTDVDSKLSKTRVKTFIFRGVEIARERRAAKLTNGRSRATKPARTRRVLDAPVGEPATSETTNVNTRIRPKFRELSKPMQAAYIGIITVGIIVPNQIQESFTGQPIIDFNHPTHPFDGPAERIEKLVHKFSFLGEL